MTSPISYDPHFIIKETADEYFTLLWAGLEWERRAPRREYWISRLDKPYTYGRGMGERTYEPKPTHGVVEEILARFHYGLGLFFEGCFLNGYENERDALGWHADDDPRIDHTRPIAVVTLGAAREIQWKPQDGGPETVESLFLEPGSLFLMQPGMQQTHYHRIPKASRKASPRISLTYRGLLE